jgi:hypothetical protein
MSPPGPAQFLPPETQNQSTRALGRNEPTHTEHPFGLDDEDEDGNFGDVVHKDL